MNTDWLFGNFNQLLFKSNQIRASEAIELIKDLFYSQFYQNESFKIRFGYFLWYQKYQNKILYQLNT